MNGQNQDHKVFKPFFIDDSRGFTKGCEICKKAFGIVVIEHKCKRCFRSICVQCGKKKALIYKQNGSAKEHRICTVCQAQYLQIEHLGAKLKFGQDSQLSTKWVGKLNKQKKLYPHILTEYTQCQALTNDSVLKFKRDSRNIFNEIYSSYNYSFRHFVSLVTKDCDSFEEKVLNVGVAVLGRLPDLSYSPELAYVVVFFLCFSSQSHAFFIITRLIERVFPLFQSLKKLKRQNLLAKQLKVMVKMIEILAETTNKDDIIMIKQYLEARITKFLQSMTINIMNFEVSLHIINEVIFKTNHLELYKGITSAMFLSKSLMSNRKTYEEIQLHILRNVNFDSCKSLTTKFQKVELDYDAKNEEFESMEFQRMQKQFKLMEKNCITLEGEMRKKNEELKTLNDELRATKVSLEEVQKKNSKFEEEIYFLGERRKEINQIESIRKSNAELQRKMEKMQKELEDSTLQMNQEAKKTYMSAEKLKWLERTNLEYETQLTELRTSNEILLVKVEAKNIDFNTDRIEAQAKERNAKIKQLQRKIQDLESEVSFLRKQASENLKGKVVEQSNGHKEPEPKTENTQYKEQIELGAKIINRQKKNIEELTEQLDRTKKSLQETQKLNQSREVRIKSLEESLGQFLKFKENSSFQATEIEEMNLLDEEIGKQEEIIRRNNLITIRRKFNECLEELRIQKLDCRIKTDKVKNMEKIVKNQVVTLSPENEAVQGSNEAGKGDDCCLF